jgi:hypothetical protein
MTIKGIKKADLIIPEEIYMMEVPGYRWHYTAFLYALNFVGFRNDQSIPVSYCHGNK